MLPVAKVAAGFLSVLSKKTGNYPWFSDNQSVIGTVEGSKLPAGKQYGFRNKTFNNSYFGKE
jgi:hypothetical protein